MNSHHTSLSIALAHQEKVHDYLCTAALERNEDEFAEGDATDLQVFTL